MSLRFEYEWLEPEGARGAELRATWAQLKIEVDGHVVTRAVHKTSKGLREGVCLPLYPLAEWLVTNWWFLRYEVEPHKPGADDGYFSRHCIRAASEGFALPALLFSPAGDTVHATWRSAALDHQRLSFTEDGHATLDANQFRDVVFNLARSVVARLHDFGITESLLESELAAIEASDEKEGRFCAAAAALGLDPYSIDEKTAKDVVETGEELPRTLVDEFFVVADATRLREQSAAILKALKSIHQNRARLDHLRDLRSEIHLVSPVSAPWKHGYKVARELRNRLGAADLRINSFKALAEALQVDQFQLKSAVVETLNGGQAFDALVHSNVRSSPAFVVAKRSQRSTLFAVCRGLYEYLMTSADGAGVVTRSRSDRQKRNRAFAAEFLVPAEQLRPLIPKHVVTSETVDDLADQFGASSAVIRHQIDNHRLATLAD